MVAGSHLASGRQAWRCPSTAHLSVKGPRGQLTWDAPEDIAVNQDGDTLLTRPTTSVGTLVPCTE